MFRQLYLGAAGAMLCIGTVSAHVTLETPQATIGASYKAVLRVPHGCDGSATTAIRVRIPAGIITVKPMPKPGGNSTPSAAPTPSPPRCAAPR